MDEEHFFARITELDRLSWERDVTKHTAFLTASEQAEILGHGHALTHPDRFFSGGWPEAERRMLIWPASYDLPLCTAPEDGDLSQCPLAEQFLALIRCCPVNARFSEDLTHRDYLGALMNLGFERDQIGDILQEGHIAWIFCTVPMASLICEELTRVRHTDVTAVTFPLSECHMTPELEELKVNVASERLDAILAAVFRLSRSKAAEAVETEKVFVDGQTASGCGMKLSEGARVSVRGLGKFIYDGIENESRKGRLFVKIRKYI